MPRDGIFLKPDTKTAALLRKAKALIDTPEKWCRGALSKDRKGVSCCPFDDLAAARCARGALCGASGEWWDEGKSVEADAALDRAAKEMGFKDFSGGGHNNAHVTLNNTTDHPTVMRMFDRAIELAREEG